MPDRFDVREETASSIGRGKMEFEAGLMETGDTFPIRACRKLPGFIDPVYVHEGCRDVTPRLSSDDVGYPVVLLIKHFIPLGA